MTTVYWRVGERTVEWEQGGRDRAGYGVALLKRLAGDLSIRFGTGFSERNLEQMRLFYRQWPISQTPSAKLAVKAESPSARLVVQKKAIASLRSYATLWLTPLSVIR